MAADRPLQSGDGVEYRCGGFGSGHQFFLRLTTMRPDPARWDGTPCGFCGAPLRRTGTVLRTIREWLNERAER